MLGVLGGMGPMATVDFLAKLVRATPAGRDQDHIPTLVCSAVDIPDRADAILGTGPDPLPALRAALARLEAGGATRIAIPCNTAHHWHAALQAATALPILHIVDAVAKTLAETLAETLARTGSGGRIGLLATDGTLRSGLYPERLARHGLACRAPDEAGQAAVSAAIRLVKADRVAEATPLLEAQVRALAEAGCDRVVMACTEIPLALAGSDPSGLLVDATEALARACVAACRPDCRVDAAALPRAA
ncbi:MULTISPECIES: amino acid racemase [Methylobacterium]|uniref:aspartate/glutamate racemase family protein n=1 Tax=Methylobacterium TaxID=407 RepID=UPI00037334FD|nr:MULTISPECIES: amino acid racemase [Methylobacterium]MBN4097772.1 aspartate/glutamate racemase family protein [Methylobacterium sp. OT2]SEG33662.1 aspartate racemase [Methylobacterium sp. 190mf]